VLAGVADHDDPVEAVARIGARLIMQQALEDEMSESSAASATSAPAPARRSTATATSRQR
jgi:hypothetical protein